MSRIAGVRAVVPGNVHRQDEITDVLSQVVLGREGPESPRRELLRRLHTSSGVRTRHLALPLDRYADLGGFGAANDAFIDVGLGLGERAITAALAVAGLTPADVDLLMTTS